MAEAEAAAKVESTSDRDAIARGRRLADGLMKPPAARMAAAGPAPKRNLLIAIGDSWFNYWPRGDVLDVLEDRLQRTIDRSAKAGRKLTEMLYPEPMSLLDEPLPPGEADGAEIGWLTKRLLEMTADERQRLQAILVSAGGNDVAGAGDVLSDVVKRKGAYWPEGPLDQHRLEEVVDVRLRGHYLTLVACIARACEAVNLGRRVPILLHGYDYPVPDGRGVLGVSWLRKPLEDLGYTQLLERVDILRQLIEKLNEMQKKLVTFVAAQPDLQAFVDLRHVDLRGTLNSDKGYTVHWQNELHPTIPFGFGEVSKKFVAELLALTRAAPGGRT
jgi:hypothetical protein